MQDQDELDDSQSLELYSGSIPTKELIDIFLQRVGKDGLKCVERLGQTSLRVYFKESVSIDEFLQNPVVIQDRELSFFRVGEKLKTIFVKGLPFNVPEQSLYSVIKTYGKVRSIGYERYAGYKPLCTGTRVIKMTLHSPIPNFLRIGKFTAVITYKNQVIICRRCGGKRHLAKGCNTPRNEFQQGFPVHTRPIATRTINLLGPSTKSAEVQTMFSTVKSVFTTSEQNISSSIQKKTSLAQRLNGLRIDGRDNEASASSSCEVTISPDKSQKKGVKGGPKVVSFAEENTVNEDLSVEGACAKIEGSSASEAVKSVSTFPNITETSESVTISKKKKKKKKKKTNK